MKIRPVGADLFHADRLTDRQTDMTKLIFVFRNFANSPKNIKIERKHFSKARRNLDVGLKTKSDERGRKNIAGRRHRWWSSHVAAEHVSVCLSLNFSRSLTICALNFELGKSGLHRTFRTVTMM